MKTFVKKIQAGFTLIELLLVISVIAVVAGVSVAMVARHAREQRIHVAALEVQQIVQAADNYYNNYDGKQSTVNLGDSAATTRWPCDDSNPGSVSEFNKEFFKYVPQGLVQQQQPSNGKSEIITIADAKNLVKCSLPAASTDPSDNASQLLTIIVPVASSAQQTNTMRELAGMLPGAYTVDHTALAPAIRCPKGSVCMQVPSPSTDPDDALHSNVSFSGVGTCMEAGYKSSSSSAGLGSVLQPLSSSTCSNAASSSLQVAANQPTCSCDQPKNIDYHSGTSSDNVLKPYLVSFQCPQKNETGFVYFNLAGFTLQRQRPMRELADRWSNYVPAMLTGLTIDGGNLKVPGVKVPSQNLDAGQAVSFEQNGWEKAPSYSKGGVMAYALENSHTQYACACIGAASYRLLELNSAGKPTNFSYVNAQAAQRDKTHLTVNYTAVCTAPGNKKLAAYQQYKRY